MATRIPNMDRYKQQEQLDEERNNVIRMGNVNTQSSQFGKEAKKLKSFRLSVGQIAFLKSQDNASQFVREAIEEKRIREKKVVTREQQIINLHRKIQLKEKEVERLDEEKDIVRANREDANEDTKEYWEIVFAAYKKEHGKVWDEWWGMRDKLKEL